MTDRAQFEAMLEALINEDQATAKEIFHNIVVGKSREIYEELLAEDFSQDTGNPYNKNEGMEEEEEEEESAGEEEEEDGDDAEDDSEEPEDDEEDPFGAEEEPEDDGEGEGDIEDRVMDLEDALEDLKAEFEQLLQGEEHEEENEPGIHGDGMPMHDIEADMMGADEHEEQEEEGVMHHVHHHMNEYVNKVPLPKHGDNGVNTKSTIDNMKNDMGGSAKNIAQSFSTEKGGTQGGLAKPNATVNDFGNINKPGGNAGKTAFKKKEPGHGPEKKGHGEGGAVSSTAHNKEGGRNTKSLISSRVR